MLRRPPRSTQSRSSAASDVYKRQVYTIAQAWAARGVGGMPPHSSLLHTKVLASRTNVSPVIVYLLVSPIAPPNRTSLSFPMYLSLIHISEPTRPY
eukprot:TRINITY_DN469_c0_g1_i14.p2 TRINITY_DN469_c0_g1~~TRINITY_DN469_c0_g1_i14.p2  ORF type:complete len:103 (+),score=21.01 TRINITY_DN469_c0_g1_i14:24-311(+)